MFGVGQKVPVGHVLPTTVWCCGPRRRKHVPLSPLYVRTPLPLLSNLFIVTQDALAPTDLACRVHLSAQLPVLSPWLTVQEKQLDPLEELEQQADEFKAKQEMPQVLLLH